MVIQAELASHCLLYKVMIAGIINIALVRASIIWFLVYYDGTIFYRQVLKY